MGESCQGSEKWAYQVASLTSDNSRYDNADGGGGGDDNSDITKGDALNRVFGFDCEGWNVNVNGI
jgi:hypothetical protein